MEVPSREISVSWAGHPGAYGPAGYAGLVMVAPYGAINAAGDPGPLARHRRQRPRSRCFYCVAPRAQAQTPNLGVPRLVIVRQCP
jgi:hypothetical protein